MSRTFSAAVIHGSGGYPGRNWFPWLKSELETRSIKTSIPQFPTPEGQNLASWTQTFETEVGSVHSNLILFGHSTGVAFLLNLLDQVQQPVLATFLVAGFIGELGHAVFDPLNASFFTRQFNWERIKSNAGQLFIYAGDNDPYVPLSKGITLAESLKSELIVVPNGGHLNQDSGFISFPRLLWDLDRMLAI
jgi:predicted alpha/beta hydrolase family esterase